MRKQLTSADIKKLKYQTRGGKIVSLIVFVIATIFITIKLFGGNPDKTTSLIFSGVILFSFVLGFILTRKYYMDIRNGEKILEKRIIQSKEKVIDHEAGSGGLGYKMKAFTSYRVIINNYRIDVDERFFNSCVEEDKVLYHIALISKHRITIELEKNGICNQIL